MRFRTLDALRGLSALIVLIHHCVLTLAAAPEGTLVWALRETPLKLITDGPGAVLVFFVLSGFALAASVDKELSTPPGQFSWPRFAVGRIARLYPPYAFAVLASAALCVAVAPHIVWGLSGWFNYESWGYKITPDIIIGELMMRDEHPYMSLLNAGWALIHIVRLSLIFPLIFFAQRRWPATTLIAMTVLSAIANFLLSHGGLALIVQTTCGSGQYLLAFAAGGQIYLSREAIMKFRAAGGPIGFGAALFASALCFLAPRDEAVIGVFLPTFGAIFLTAALLAKPGPKPPPGAGVLLWLGDISFSLYLVHLPVLLTVFHLFWGKAPAGVLVASTMALALAAATLTHVAVEKPFIALSRRWRKPQAKPALAATA